MGRRSIFVAALAALCLSSVGATSCGPGNDVAGRREAISSQSERAAIERFRTYLVGNAGALVIWTAKMRNQIAAGDLARAQSRYATARVQFGQVEPVARSLDDLMARIDATGGAGGVRFLGFHAVEKALFLERTTEGVLETAKRLLADVEELHRRLGTIDLLPERIAANIDETMIELSELKVAGTEERYSRIDLVGIAANTEGVEASFKAVEPLLATAMDRVLVARIEDRFKAVYASLRPYGLAAREPQSRPAAAGARFVSYADLSRNDIQGFARPIRALAELLARIPDRIAPD